MRSRGTRPSSTPISASRTKEHCVIALGQFLEILIGGLLSGVLYSLVALGFVLIFKASGVFNFAQVAMALLAGLALVRSLDLLVAHGFPLWAAVMFGVVFAALIMALTAWLVASLFRLRAALVLRSKLVVHSLITFLVSNELPVLMMCALPAVPSAIIGCLTAEAGEKISEGFVRTKSGGGIEYWFALVLR